MYCEHCGKEINDGSRFCQYCGSKIRPVEAAAENIKAESEAFKEKPEVIEEVLKEAPAAEEAKQPAADEEEAVFKEPEEAAESLKEAISEAESESEQGIEEAAKEEIPEADIPHEEVYEEISQALNAPEDETPVTPSEEIGQSVEKIINEEPSKAPEEPSKRTEEKPAESAASKREDKKTEKKAEERKSEEKKASQRKAQEEKKKEEPVRQKKEPERVSGTVVGSDSYASNSSGQARAQIHYSAGIEGASRKALGSAWLLIGTIALAAQVVLMLFYTFTDRVYEVMNFMLRLFGVTIDAVFYTRIAIAAVAVVEIILIVGFLITFINANRKKKLFKTAGLTILQVLCAIGLILICFAGLCAIGAALVAIRYITHYAFISFEGISTGQIVYVCCMLAFLIILYILFVIFFAKLVSSIGRAKRAAAEGYARKNIALFNVFMLFLIALCIIAFAVISIFTSAPSSIIIISGEICLALACIFYAAFMIMYRSRMREFL